MLKTIIWPIGLAWIFGACTLREASTSSVGYPADGSGSSIEAKTPSASVPSSSTFMDLNQFWSALLNDIRSKDALAFANKSGFPLVLRGETDDTPSAQLTRNELLNDFERLMREPTLRIDGSEGSLAELLFEAGAPVMNGATSVIHSNLGLRKSTPEGWKVVEIYVEEPAEYGPAQ